MNRRAQSAVEFVGLIAFMFIVFFGFFLLLQNQILDATREQDAQLLASLNAIVISEVDVATSVQPDFQNTFRLPALSKDYSLELVDNRDVVVTLDDGTQYINFLPRDVIGELFPPGTSQTIYRYDGYYARPDGVRVYDIDFEGVFLNVPAEKCKEHDMNGSCSSLSSEDLALCSAIFSLC